MPVQIHNTIGWLLVLVTLGLVGFSVPPTEDTIGESYLIFFFHFPSAINCMIFFLIAGGVGLYLVLSRFKNPRADLWAASAVEIGLLACTITLVTGSIWAKAAWGHWWNFKDPRLMTVAIMWFTYAGYVAFRAAIDDPVQRARFCAVFAVVAAVNVPIVWFAIAVLGRVKHPETGVTMGEPSMIFARRFGLFAFLVLYTALWRLRSRVLRHRHEVASLEEEFHRAGI